MADPLAITFDLLAATKAAAAVEVLVGAADSKVAAIQDRAVAALLRRGTTRCQTEVIRRVSSLTPAGQKLLAEQGPRLSATLRQCLLHGDAELRANALPIVRKSECYDQVSTLLQMLDRRDDPFCHDVCQTLQDLVQRLHEYVHVPGGRKLGDHYGQNPAQIRQIVLSALEGASNRCDTISHGREVVECALALGDPDHFAIRKILLQSAPSCREMAGDLLLTSKHPGVMRLLMEFMGQNYPINKAFEAFEKRADLEFVCYVLQTFPKRLSENQQKNYKQLKRINWIADELIPLEAIPKALHASLVAFVQATSIDADYKIEVQKWLMMHGSQAARGAAGEVLETLAPESLRGFLFGGLESDDEDVQAWATSQLRAQGVPEAIRLLIERLDSPLPAVREAARGELQSFNLGLMLNIFDQLDAGVCKRAGALMKKVDGQWKQKLCDELRSPIQRRRIRAARAAHALGLGADVQSGLLTMLADEDALARRTAAEVLGSVATPEVAAALTDLLNDSSARVRETAANSLEELRRAGFQSGHPDPLVLTRPETAEGG